MKVPKLFVQNSDEKIEQLLDHPKLEVKMDEDSDLGVLLNYYDYLARLPPGVDERGWEELNEKIGKLIQDTGYRFVRWGEKDPGLKLSYAYWEKVNGPDERLVFIEKKICTYKHPLYMFARVPNNKFYEFLDKFEDYDGKSTGFTRKLRKRRVMKYCEELITHKREAIQAAFR